MCELVSLTAVAHGASSLDKTMKNLSDCNGLANVLLQAECSQKQFHSKNASVLGFGASGLASTIFTFASVFLKSLQEGFKLTFFSVCCMPLKNLSASVVVQLPCERGISRYMFDRGKRCYVSCVSSFVQIHASERKKNATSHQPSIGRPTVVPVTACASSEKQVQVTRTFGSKDIAWEVVAVCLTRHSHRKTRL